MINEKAYQVALRVFNKTRTNVAGCLRAAIEAFRLEEIEQLRTAHASSSLTVSTADTENGPDTALVITGFSDIEELECFVCEKFHASGK